MKNSLSIKLNRCFLALALLFILLNHLEGQVEYFNKRIDHYHNKDHARNIIETDNGYIIGGHTYPDDPAYKYNIHLTFTGITFEGEEYLFKEYGYDTINMFLGNPGSLIDYSDTTYFSVGTKRIFTESYVHDQGMLSYYNQSFVTLWTKLYGEQSLPFDTAFLINQVKKTVNNNLIMTGLRLPMESPSHIWLMKTDSLGNKLWERFFGDNEYYFQGHSVVQTDDGGYVIGAFKFKIGINSSSDPVIIKTDSLGNQEWRINPGNPDVDDNKVMVALANSGNIIAGTNYGTQESGDNQWMVVKIMKITSGGEILWNYNYGNQGYDNFLANTIILENGNIITNGGETIFDEDEPNRISWILCVDSLGGELWHKQYAILLGDDSQNRMYDVKQTSDNGLIGCGMVMPIVPDTGTADIWVMKMDSVGCFELGCDTTVSISELTETENGFMVYPNPAREYLTIKYDLDPYQENQIFMGTDIKGNIFASFIPQEDVGFKIIDLRKLVPGTYIVYLKAANEILQSTKFTKY